MSTAIRSLTVLASLSVSLLAGCVLFSPEKSIPKIHPESLPQGNPVCTDCHEGQIVKVSQKPYSAFNHGVTFVREHRFAAAQNEQICAVCHAVSFCLDCHAGKTEIKPATKLGNRPDRELIHRGDFLTRHRTEGKIDPASCYTCHGRANNQKCATCHR